MPEAPTVERELFVRRLASMEMAGIDPPESFVGQLLAAARDVHFGPGEVLYEERGSAEWFYLLRQGMVELIRDDAKPWRFVDGAVGILDAIIGRSHERTAIAVEPTTCLAINSADYFAMLEDHADYSHGVVRFQASRLHTLHRELPDREKRFSRPANWRLIRKGARILGMVERLIVLRQVPAFAASSIQSLVSLAECSTSQAFEHGSVLFREGDVSTKFWIVADGRVAIESEGKRESVRGPGELIESYAAFGHARRQYTATTLSPVVMVAIDEDELFDRMEVHFELTRSVMSYLAKKWEQINLSIAAQSGTFEAIQGRG